MKTYKIYLTDSLEELKNEVLLAKGCSLKELIKQAYSELEARGIKTEAYSRYLGMPDGLAIDFGSWSKFLFIMNATMDEVFKA